MEMSGINQDENNTASDGTCDDSSKTEMEKKSILERSEAMVEGVLSQVDRDMRGRLYCALLLLQRFYIKSILYIFTDGLQTKELNEVTDMKTDGGNGSDIALEGPVIEVIGMNTDGENGLDIVLEEPAIEVTDMNTDGGNGVDIVLEEPAIVLPCDDDPTVSTSQEEVREGMDNIEFIGVPEIGEEEEVIVQTTQDQGNATSNEASLAENNVQENSRKRRIRATYNDPLSKSMIQVKYTYIKSSDSSFSANANSQTQPRGEQATIPTVTISSDDSDSGKK